MVLVTTFSLVATAVAASATRAPVRAPERYIVSFDSYVSVELAAQIVGHALDSAAMDRGVLRLVPSTAWRRLALVAPPSDFAVVAPARSAADGADPLTAVRASRRVRRVTRDRVTKLSPSASPASRNLTSIAAPESHYAPLLWAQGLTGQGVRVAVFDSGLASALDIFRTRPERTDWTGETSDADEIGHGTFVAGVIASTDPLCPGFAPDASLLVCRVFTRAQLSFTSWFLDAFNYVLASDVDVLNLSVGGPDFLDAPFVEKINELSANGVVVVSAIGNDGPLYGTLNNPGDQLDVIGVGGVEADGSLAEFSSRGMTTWELPGGYGRVKPDVLAYASGVLGPSVRPGSCRQLTGTSVASPVVTGAVALLLSLEPSRELRRERLNPAAIKQALIESAHRLPGPNVFEQGAGLINLPGALALLRAYEPRTSVYPASLDLTDCPYMWPMCDQPVFADARPLVMNVTLLNGMAVYGELAGEPVWVPEPGAVDALEVTFIHSSVLWPWSGWLGVLVSVRANAAALSLVAAGTVHLRVASVLGPGRALVTDLAIPLRVAIVPTPPRESRVLWDTFHSLRYPAGFVPRDALGQEREVLDWHGDHPHTNLRGLYHALRAGGFYIETLGEPIGCASALSRYGTFLLVDTEDEFFAAEVDALADAVRAGGLSLVVLADWFDTELASGLDFYDENTGMTWHPITGGANVPALNDVLAPFGGELGSLVWRGTVSLGGQHASFQSGSHVTRWPVGGRVHRSMMTPESRRVDAGADKSRAVIVLALAQLAGPGAGRVVVFGDSSCADTAFKDDGYWLASGLVAYAARGVLPHGWASAFTELGETLDEPGARRAVREPTSDLPFFSRVVGARLECSAGAEHTHAHAHAIDDALAAHAHYSGLDAPFNVGLAGPSTDADRGAGTGAGKGADARTGAGHARGSGGGGLPRGAGASFGRQSAFGVERASEIRNEERTALVLMCALLFGSLAVWACVHCAQVVARGSASAHARAD